MWSLTRKTKTPKTPTKEDAEVALVVPVVGSPGVNVMLSQASPRFGVKRSSTTPPQIPRLSRRNKKRKLKSEIWNDFDPVYDGNKLKEANCKHCKRIFVVARKAGTSECIRHLLVCEERAKVNEFLDSIKSAMPQPDPNSVEKWNYDPERAHWELVRMIVVHELPFSIVEYDGFRRSVHSLNPTFEVVSRTTIRLDSIMLFEEQRVKLREDMHNLTSRVSLTADMWTSIQVVSYMCITCHFVSENWKLQKKVIWFAEAKTPHDGANLFNIMLECIQGWGLTTKIFSITLDNASNNNSCVGFIKSNLLGKSLLPCKGDLLHGRCASHVINIMVQDGLEVTCKAVDNIRESIKFVRSSPTRKQKFREIVAQEGIACRKNLSLDVVTRWNSTHLMIKTTLEYRRAFAAMKSHDTTFTCLPTNVEWETAESVCNFLEVFLDATMVVSGTLYPTAHLYFHELWKIHLTLQRAAKHKDIVIKSMAEAMQKKFIKYWKLSYLTICLPVILDPRYKFKFLEFCLKSGLESEATRYLAKVKRTFKNLFVEYSVHEGDSHMRNDR
uniref:BED-type domain-containing protein n=1 Tax=Hordeum vulgare subsp. vulgare TaxID=112509 RepID=A0A8I6XFM1_HORVV